MKPFFRLALACLTVVATASPIQARDLRMDLPIIDAMRNATWRASVASGIEFRFGADYAVPAGAVLSQVVKVTNYARPWVSNGVTRVRREDAPTCNEALRNALGDLAEQAKKIGASSVVNISSKYLDSVQTSRTEFACNSGTGSAEVELSAQFLIRTASAPASAKQADSVSTERIFPAASNFSALNDLSALPNLVPGCRKFYEDEWLKAALPRAFAVAANGQCRGAWSTTPRNPEEPKDPARRALELCAKHTGSTCKLYAVDDTVVYRP